MEPIALIKTSKLRPKEPSMTSCSSEVLCSVRSRGIINPLLITSDFQVYIGNQRLAAARQLKIDEVPCRVVYSSENVKEALMEYKVV